MKLTNDTRDAVLAHLNERWKHKGCLRCERNDWTLDAFVSLPLADSADGDWGDIRIPTIAAICNHCGSIELIAARAIDALEDEG